MGQSIRRTLILAALLASGTMLLAQQQATFIKNNGERISGMVESRTVGRSFFNRTPSFLVNVNNQQVQVPMNDVAVIDFDLGGARPSTRELNALPTDGNHLLVLRNGSQREGRLVSFVGGDAVRWSYEPGDTEDIPMRDVRRIYLNPDGARNAYNSNAGQYGNQYGYGDPQYDNSQYGDGNNQPYGNRSGGLRTQSTGLEVPANVAWTDTGVDVRAGENLSFAANGQIMFGRDSSMTASADGNPSMKNQSYPVPGVSVGTLIGRVGRTAPFVIGTNRRSIQMPASGRLLLGVNDDGRSDNSGAFNVVIRDTGNGNAGNGTGPRGRAYGYYGNRGDAYGGGSGELLSPSNGLQVQANIAWTDTGIDVQAGDMLSFSPSGEVRWGRGPGDTASADGNSASIRNNYPVRSAGVGALIGRLGGSAPFMIGSNTGAIRMPTSGRLLLGVNDDNRGDNSGSY
jgi:hypothetical protein